MSTTKALERHYTAKELAQMWRIDPSTVRELFKDEPGVFRIGEAHRRGKRGYVSMRIPESIAVRVHEERSK